MIRISVRLLGIAIVLYGLNLAGTALLSDAGELQSLLGVYAVAGFMIALAGGALFAIGGLFGRGKAKASAPPRLT